jgi:hypothetical protein
MQTTGNIPSSVPVSHYPPCSLNPAILPTLSDPAEIEKLAKEKLSQGGWYVTPYHISLLRKVGTKECTDGIGQVLLLL